MTCVTCKFWDVGDWLCRRRSPTTVAKGSGHAVWPATSKDDWCGEYELRPAPAVTAGGVK